jgi:hypothetical protein
MKNLEAMQLGEPASDFDEAQINEDLAKLPDRPDENLR